jgi:hypothetical protein
MIHPEHGAMHAYDTGEIERLQKLGWSIEGEKSQGEVHIELIKATVAPPARKPGRPPKAK